MRYFLYKKYLSDIILDYYIELISLCLLLSIYVNTACFFIIIVELSIKEYLIIGSRCYYYTGCNGILGTMFVYFMVQMLIYNGIMISPVRYYLLRLQMLHVCNNLNSCCVRKWNCSQLALPSSPSVSYVPFFQTKEEMYKVPRHHRAPRQSRMLTNNSHHKKRPPGLPTPRMATKVEMLKERAASQNRGWFLSVCRNSQFFFNAVILC